MASHRDDYDDDDDAIDWMLDNSALRCQFVPIAARASFLIDTTYKHVAAKTTRSSEIDVAFVPAADILGSSKGELVELSGSLKLIKPNPL